MRRIAVALIAAGLLAGSAPPALGQGTECPPGWDEAPASTYPDADRNGDGSICTRTVPGEGNAGEGTVAKDNNSDDGDGGEPQA